MLRIHDRESMVDAIGRELHVNQATLEISPDEIAGTVIDWIGSPPPYDASLIAYGSGVGLGVSLQIAIVSNGVLYDMEFDTKSQALYFIALNHVESVKCLVFSESPESSVKQCRLDARLSNKENGATYTAIGDQARIGDMLRFFKELTRAWEKYRG